LTLCGYNATAKEWLIRLALYPFFVLWLHWTDWADRKKVYR